MWTTIVLLGLAVSVEPAKVGLNAFLLTKRHPVRHLLTYLVAGFTMSFSVGMLVLFVFHHAFTGSSSFKPAFVQIGMAAFAFLLAALLASNISLGKLAPKSTSELAVDFPDNDRTPESTATGGPKGWVTRVKDFLRGESRWLSGSAGVALAMPSVDYMALLALIIASRKPPLVQTAALVTFLLLASSASVIPLFGYLIAPERTRELVQHFNVWIRTRTRRHAAIFVAILGLILLAVGLHGL